MTTNRLAKATDDCEARGTKKKECPPDMPRGDSVEQKDARVRFWIEYGNRHLVEIGKPHLHWKHSNGNYWIEDRY